MKQINEIYQGSQFSLETFALRARDNMENTCEMHIECIAMYARGMHYLLKIKGL